VARQSAITEMLEISHFQTIYNVFVAVFLISLTNMLLHNYYESGTTLEFHILWWSFGGLPQALLLWTGLFFASFSVVILQKGIVTRQLSPYFAYTLYIFIQLLLFSGVPQFVRSAGFGPATSCFVMLETVRLCMKMHSYIMVNRMLRLTKEIDDTDPSVRRYPANVTFTDFFHFLFFPTLIYQTQYPRTKSVRVGFIVRRLSESFLCVLYIYAILVRYCAPHVPEMIGDYRSLVLGIFKVMIPGIGMSLLAFFMVLHSWMNAWAEITCFADRYFYSDWWNATSWSTYYRKWNFLVHNFIHRHIFTELLMLHCSKTVAMWATFIFSAIIHEYVISVSMGFYKPILLLMFLVPGVLFIYLTRILGQGSRAWNVFMWAMLIVGHGTLIGLYSRAWYKYFHSSVHETWVSLIWIV